MFPFGIGAAIGLGSAAIQGVTGLLDMFRGRKKEREAEKIMRDRPYEIGSAYRSSLGVAERQAAGTRLPAEDLRRAQIGEATAAGVGQAKAAATSASDVLGVLAGLYGSQQMAEQNLAIEGAQRFDQNQYQLQRALNMFGEQQDIEWQQNVLAPAQQRWAQAQQYGERGRAGLGAAFSGLGQTFGGVLAEQGAQGRFDDYMDYMRGGAEVTPFMRSQYNRNKLNRMTNAESNYANNQFKYANMYRTPLIGGDPSKD